MEYNIDIVYWLMEWYQGINSKSFRFYFIEKPAKFVCVTEEDSKSLEPVLLFTWQKVSGAYHVLVPHKCVYSTGFCCCYCSLDCCWEQQIIIQCTQIHFIWVYDSICNGRQNDNKQSQTFILIDIMAI